MIYQLRIYEVFEHNKGAFHTRFSDHAYPIMKQYGFDFGGAWESQTPERTEFVYILRWPDEAAMRSAWEGFMADEEWAAIKVETRAKHGDMVGTIQDQVLQRVDALPGRWQ